MGEPVWRLGHRAAPLDFVPWELCGWQHRWDDPSREYRTLYAAADPSTCLREVLADLRPNLKVLADLRELFGDATTSVRDAGLVTDEWRDAHRLCPARARCDGDLADVDGDLALRRELEREHAALLAAHGLEHLDVSEVRSRDRIVTQTVGRSLFRRGHAGVAFGSNLDDGRCVAVFEGRGRLTPHGPPLELAADLSLLVRVCDELGLRIGRD